MLRIQGEELDGERCRAAHLGREHLEAARQEQLAAARLVNQQDGNEGGDEVDAGDDDSVQQGALQREGGRGQGGTEGAQKKRRGAQVVVCGGMPGHLAVPPSFI